MQKVNINNIISTELIDGLNNILAKDGLSENNDEYLKDINDIGVYIVTYKGEILGIPDNTRLKKAKWYQKILAWLSRKYKQKFIDVKPIEIG